MTVATPARVGAAMRSTRSRWEPRTEHWAAVATVGVLAAHLGLRDFRWLLEWPLATWQYCFATVMLGPLASGFAAWKAVGWARTIADPAAAAGRQTAVVWRSTCSIVCWMLGVYLVGYLGVLAAVALSGTPWTPTLSDFLPILSACALIVAFGSLGSFFGWRVRSFVVPPLVALVGFASCVALYRTAFGFLSDAGGASGSLVGLRPNPMRVLLQLTAFASVSALLTISAGKDHYLSRRAGVLRGSLGAVVAILIVGGALTSPERLLQDPADAVVCGEAMHAPVVCLGPGYGDRVQPISEALGAPLAQLRVVGVELDLGPFDQRPSAPGSVVNPDLLDRGADGPAQYVANALLSPTCSLSDEVVNAFNAMVWWLTPESPKRDDFLPSDETAHRLASDDPQVVSDEVHALVNALSGC